MLCMALLLQAYFQTSDAEAVRPSATDGCWRMVLGTLCEEDKPAFSQGGLQRFREHLIAHEMDRRLLERTVEVAKATKAFDAKKAPKSLRVGVDSRPLEGAVRVEGTFNLLGHAGRKVAVCMALVLGTDIGQVCQQANVPLLMASSIKAGLDLDWSDADAKARSISKPPPRGARSGRRQSCVIQPVRRSRGGFVQRVAALRELSLAGQKRVVDVVGMTFGSRVVQVLR